MKNTVTCSFCGRQFREEDGVKGCSGCALAGGCKKIKCPYCGFESLREPAIIKWLKHKARRKVP